MDYPLSDTDLMHLMNGQTKIIKYEQLSDYHSVKELLAPYGNVIILYPTGRDIGHWTCLFYGCDPKYGKVIEFYDPYGIKLEEEFCWTPKQYRLEHFLSQLLAETGKGIVYNDHKFQRMAENINTCGRHVVVRLWNAATPLNKYIKLFRGGKGFTSDELVTYLTS